MADFQSRALIFQSLVIFLNAEKDRPLIIIHTMNRESQLAKKFTSFPRFLFSLESDVRPTSSISEFIPFRRYCNTQLNLATSVLRQEHAEQLFASLVLDGFRL